MTWKEQFEEVLKKRPKYNDVLTSENGEPFTIKTITEEGKTPILYAHAYPSMVVGQEPKWFIITGFGGIRCILLQSSVRIAINRYGLGKPFEVKSLKVIKETASKKALLCEVLEWL